MSAVYADFAKSGTSLSGYERDTLYLNLGGGKFTDISGVSGLDSITDGRGPVYGDFDNDGDLDIFLPTIQGATHLLFRNNVGQSAHWIRLTLVGTRSGKDAFGAVARVKTSAGIQTRIKSGGEGFLSQHDGRLLFGLGEDPTLEWIEVSWPSGLTQRFSELPPGRSFKLVEGGELSPTTELRTRLPDSEINRSLSARASSEFATLRGKQLPLSGLTDLDGRGVPLSLVLNPSGKTVINFWATWCRPCAKEMPFLESLKAPLAQRGIRLVGLSLDLDEVAKVQRFVTAMAVSYPVYIAGKELLATIFAGDRVSVPITLVVDEHRVVEEVIVGFSGTTARRLRSLAGLQSAPSP